MDLQLRGKVALVTAASKGLGKATAWQFAHEGAKVVISARSELVEKAAAEIASETGAEVLAVRADVTQPSDIERVINTTVERFGGLDILVTNAGGPPSGTFDETDLATWETAINLNLLSAVSLVKYALPHLRQSTAPAILTITSTSTKQPVKNLVLSNSIRLGVIGLTKTLSQELGKDQIRVNSTLPGWTYTGRVEELINARMAKTGQTKDAEVANINAAVPLGRMGRPEEFANVAVFLCSPAASFVNGVMLQVDGGLNAGTF
ncbi:Short-chain dehydrogenase/reductase SDR [Trichormus variabilis ATCC 29413]|uniref:Short-chain dehydrogenase/reductase SDR n=2 Tax=Anabaena variabilis TaxID=264691 RepID=Q3MGE9_TRIV2|nr:MULTISPECIES: SDR family oxidoreductase [Nostocaceae]ABA19937.1 Short-chain dehydrogenase/reductase SDR [Trichormus variabilis ATCC 29413]MBC1213583.1 SDR family oxidoreductase [Trichormus variabilis ARAD]MBC1255616.1 SDR family oxidoreductase [Trichormus variabilis V5]MBC1269824.1 SDR family oxidoreductase [Trichormus variabilis FSR]MBC1304935.1 SDR family oxidoreductase [Trichormus variabilis N2B]